MRERTDELRNRTRSLKAEIAERQQTEQELRRTRSFLDVIIESLPAMLLVKDANTGNASISTVPARI